MHRHAVVHFVHSRQESDDIQLSPLPEHLEESTRPVLLPLLQESSVLGRLIGGLSRRDVTLA